MGSFFDQVLLLFISYTVTVEGIGGSQVKIKILIDPSDFILLQHRGIFYHLKLHEFIVSTVG